LSRRLFAGLITPHRSDCLRRIHLRGVKSHGSGHRRDTDLAIGRVEVGVRTPRPLSLLMRWLTTCVLFLGLHGFLDAGGCRKGRGGGGKVGRKSAICAPDAGILFDTLGDRADHRLSSGWWTNRVNRSLPNPRYHLASVRLWAVRASSATFLQQVCRTMRLARCNVWNGQAVSVN